MPLLVLHQGFKLGLLICLSGWCTWRIRPRLRSAFQWGPCKSLALLLQNQFCPFQGPKPSPLSTSGHPGKGSVQVRYWETLCGGGEQWGHNMNEKNKTRWPFSQLGGKRFSAEIPPPPKRSRALHNLSGLCKQLSPAGHTRPGERMWLAWCWYPHLTASRKQARACTSAMPQDAPCSSRWASTGCPLSPHSWEEGPKSKNTKNLGREGGREGEGRPACQVLSDLEVAPWERERTVSLSRYCSPPVPQTRTLAPNQHTCQSYPLKSQKQGGF